MYLPGCRLLDQVAAGSFRRLAEAGLPLLMFPRFFLGRTLSSQLRPEFSGIMPLP
jgi:hypothetical protein